jgi:cytochrome c oxidase cbb3-type subunit 4
VKAQITFEHIVSTLVTNWWTPAFVLLFLAVVAYAFWPKNRGTFDEAAKIPLRED